MQAQVLIDEVDVAIDDKGIALQRAGLLGAKDPGRLQLGNILAINLIQRRIMRRGGISMVDRPILGSGGGQQDTELQELPGHLCSVAGLVTSKRDFS